MKTVPFTLSQIQEIAKHYPTPFHIYDEKALRENARAFKKAFSILPGFQEYFAVKALPNPHILQILKEEWFGTDCSSLTELLLSEKVGITGENIMFTSNDTPLEEFQKAKELGASINLDDRTHIDFLHKTIWLPKTICLRYNPWSLKEGNDLIGKPEEAKYGCTREQIIEGYRICKDLGVQKFGLHTMVCSNERNEEYFIETAKILFDLALEIERTTDVRLDSLNLWGWIGIPYLPEQKAVDYDKIAQGVKHAYDAVFKKNNSDRQPHIFLECGRVITWPYGYLVTRAIHTKDTYKKYIGMDACMVNLMRPGMYGAYHHITVLGKEQEPATQVYDITWSLCENNDKFAIDRPLPPIEIGDILAIHDTGAHGHAMGFQYNGKLRSAELLLQEDWSVKQIRRAETVEDYFATLDF